MTQFYVYEHWRPDLDCPFYIGKGKGRRAWLIRGRGTLHTTVVELLGLKGIGVEIKIVKCGLTEREAFTFEMERISYWKSNQIELVNQTNGGDGTWGLKYTEDRRIKLSRALKGQKRSPEQCARNSAAQKRRPPFSEDTRRKISEAGKNRKFTENHKNKIRAMLIGRKKSEAHRAAMVESQKTAPRPPRSLESRARMSLAQKNRVLPPEVWVRIKSGLSRAHKGKVMSDESRHKMSISQTGRRHGDETKNKMRHSALIREALKREARSLTSTKGEVLMANIAA